MFYCADVETFQDSDGDGIGDLRGMTDRIEYLADLGITCLWLMPLYPTAGPRRRLRHHRLLRRRPAPGHPRRLRRAGAHGALGRHPGGRRLRHEPHLRPAPVVQAAPAAASTTPTAASTSGRPPSRARARPRSSSPTRRTASGNATRRPASTTCTTSTGPSPTSTSANPQVQEQIASTLGYWLALGVSGFRIDAVPFLFANDTYPGSEPERLQPAGLPQGRARLRHPPPG